MVASIVEVTSLEPINRVWLQTLGEWSSNQEWSDAFMQYRVMDFGLRNAGATFQRFMSIVLSNVPNCEAYLDDVVCYSDMWEGHLETLNDVFKCLRNANLTLNLSKCEFGCATVTYLGKEVGNGQVRPLNSKVQAILDFPVPTSKKELRRFLGMTGYYRCFCKKNSVVASPLTKLLSKAVSFKWSP